MLAITPELQSQVDQLVQLCLPVSYPYFALRFNTPNVVK